MFEGTTNVYFAGSQHFCALYKCFGAQDIFLRTIIYVYLILPHLDGHNPPLQLKYFYLLHRNHPQ